jgi:DNA-directed RNA polymerase subunit beta'
MFEPKQQILDFDAIRLSLASPETILNWSYGEVTRPETINYRTQKPEKEGLFDERIFGPTKDWECYCGKYKRIRYKGIICDKCGVEVTHSLVRRQRMGHISLETPAAHIWFLRSVPSKIGLILDLSVQALEKVIYFINFIIIKVDEDAKKEILEKIKIEYKNKQRAIWAEFSRASDAAKTQFPDDAIGLDKENLKLAQIRDGKISELDEDFKTTEKEIKEIKPLAIISEDTYHRLSLRYGYLFDAGIGAEAVRDLLSKINLEATINAIEKDLTDSNVVDVKRNKMLRRIKLLKSLKKQKIRPEWMILTHIPVIPPDLRPMVALDGGRFATSDLNDLYRRVINRNNRLKRLKELNAPEVISRNEKRMLQEAVDSLIDNSARQSKTTVAQAGKKRQLKSLADILKGKQGRFRQNLLGKRIDYSGRSVIVVGPNLKLNQCGIPKRMALELFRPFVISRIIKAGYVHNIRSANRFIETNKSEIWDILEDIVKSSFVLLNRAPTLHRLGIQAFQPVLIEGKAIQIHPLVCVAYNADFDGDQMAVHVPLTDEAKKEAETLMLATLNLLKPATGNPISNPNKDIAWGCYYLTIMDNPDEETKKIYSIEEALYAYQTNHLNLHKKIKARLKDGTVMETTIGRIIFNNSLPKELPFYNNLMSVKKLGDVIKTCLELCGREKTVEILDTIKELGFNIITRSGYSWSSSDLPELTAKAGILKEGAEIVAEIENQYNEGLLTQNERRNKIIQTWADIKERVTKLVQDSLAQSGSVFSMIDSGARGTIGQLTQMAGMKGSVSNPSGKIIELPIKKGFKEGLDVLEYFIATHGTRKGLADTALRTANAGYLTRRLVDVAQDVVIREEDCGESEGILITVADSNEIGEPFAKRITGRFVAETIKNPKTNEIIAKKNTLITDQLADEIAKQEVLGVKVRSVLKCKSHKGVCQKCYGIDLAYSEPVKIGTSVGIIAAQSIGEPGTQLTMRTFHTGGVAGLDITQGLPRVEELFEARTPKIQAIITDIAGTVAIEEAAEREISGPRGKTIISPTSGQKVIKIKSKGDVEDLYDASGTKKLALKDGTEVAKGDVLFVKEDGNEIKAKHKGVVKIEGKKKIKVIWQGEREKEFPIPAGYNIWVSDGDLVTPGDQLTEGDVDLHELYRLKGKEAVQNYILRSILNIYLSQGQKLNDKHIEVIIRQMFSRVFIKDPGETELLPGEVVERSEFAEENEKAEMNKLKGAEGVEMFMGISRISLSTRSFLSAASFQETAKVLINAATTGKIDPLEGLKENVIIGRLIPAGTGFDYEAPAE